MRRRLRRGEMHYTGIPARKRLECRHTALDSPHLGDPMPAGISGATLRVDGGPKRRLRE